MPLKVKFEDKNAIELLIQKIFRKIIAIFILFFTSAHFLKYHFNTLFNYNFDFKIEISYILNFNIFMSFFDNKSF